MDCPKTTLFLRLVSGELPPEQQSELRQHLDECPACSVALAELDDAWRALDEWEVDAAGIDLTEGVLQRIEAGPVGRFRFVRWFGSVPEPVRVAASIALAVGLGVGAGRLVPLPQSSQPETQATAAVSADDLAEAPRPGSVRRAVGHRAAVRKKPADVFGMGATLYKLLTGAAPFAASSPYMALIRTDRGEYEPIHSVRPDVSEATAKLITTCLDLDPSARFPDASCLLEALEICREALRESDPSEDYTSLVSDLVRRDEQGRRVSTDPPATPFPELRGMAPSGREITPSQANDLPALDPLPSVTPSPPPAPPAVPSAAEDAGTATPIRIDRALGALGVDREPSAAPQPEPAGRRPRGAVLAVLTFAALAITAVIWWTRGTSPSDVGDGNATTPISKTEPQDQPPPAPVEKPGLFITSDPPSALVTVDGERRGQTPLLVQGLAEGGHTVRIEKENYTPFEAEDAEALYEERTELPVILERAKGRLALSGGAPGAQVTLERSDDASKSFGLTLDDAGATAGREFEAGVYSVTATAQGFDPYEGRITIRAEGSESVSLGMQERDGTFSVTSEPPGATVLVDGAAVGTTPLEAHPLPAGPHEVLFELAEHEAPAPIPILIRGDRLKTLSGARLEPWPELDLGALGADVTARIAGRTVSDGERIAPGEVTAEFEREGYARQELRQTARAGEPLRLSPKPWADYQALLDLGGLPQDVTVLVDGAPAQKTVLTFAEAKSVRVELLRAGHESQEHTIGLALGKTERPPKSAWKRLVGTLNLSGMTAGVSVHLGGRVVENPAQFAPGDYQLTLRRAGYVDQSVTVTVRAGAVTPVRAGPWQRDRISAARAKQLLSNLTTWDGASTKERRETAERVAEKTPGFTLKALQTFSCGGQTHEVAVFTHARTGLEFVLVPAGRFRMGSPTNEEGRDDDEKQHRVTLTTAYLIAQAECTQRDWNRVGGSNTPNWKGLGLPVEQASWREADQWCRKAGLRLPTEAEWEYACRAGTTARFCFGDADNRLGAFAWLDDNSGKKTHAAGTRQPNAFGLFDMHGNVWEWCADWLADYPTGAVTDPTGPSRAAEYRVMRGGAWFLPAEYGRSAGRAWAGPGHRSPDLGFRPARSVTVD